MERSIAVRVAHVPAPFVGVFCIHPSQAPHHNASIPRRVQVVGHEEAMSFLQAHDEVPAPPSAPRPVRQALEGDGSRLSQHSLVA